MRWRHRDLQRPSGVGSPLGTGPDRSDSGRVSYGEGGRSYSVREPGEDQNVGTYWVDEGTEVDVGGTW